MVMIWTNGTKQKLNIKMPLESVNLNMVREFEEQQPP
jgi:hypothetical protein